MVPPSGSADATRYSRRPEILWRRTFDRVVILVPSTDEVVDLGESGVGIWDLLGEPMTPAELAGDLAVEYAAEAQDIVSDVTSVLEDLVALGVLTRS